MMQQRVCLAFNQALCLLGLICAGCGPLWMYQSNSELVLRYRMGSYVQRQGICHLCFCEKGLCNEFLLYLRLNSFVVVVLL